MSKNKEIEKEIEDLERQIKNKKEEFDIFKKTNGNKDVQELSSQIKILEKNRIDFICNGKKEERNKVEKEIGILQEKINNMLAIEERVAILIHKFTCKSNHTDSCFWYHEIENGLHDWESYAHKNYLEKSKKLLSIIKYEEVIEILESKIF